MQGDIIMLGIPSYRSRGEEEEGNYFKESMIVHKYFVLREGRKCRDSLHASMPPLVVLGEPLCNLVWRKTRKPTARAYSPRMLLLQTTHKVVK